MDECVLSGESEGVVSPQTGESKGELFPFGRGGGKSHHLEIGVRSVSDAAVYFDALNLALNP